MIFADKLIQLRKKSGWSQEELAEQMNVTRQSVSKWEGAQSIPDLEKIVRLSELFGVSTDYLLKDEMEEEECSCIAEEVSSLSRVRRPVGRPANTPVRPPFGGLRRVPRRQVIPTHSHYPDQYTTNWDKFPSEPPVCGNFFCGRRRLDTPAASMGPASGG